MTDSRDSQANCHAIRHGFTRVFWGFMLVLLDIRINRLDILPDFVGYMSIASALGMILFLHPKFATARVFATVMIFLSLANLIEVKHASHDSGIFAYAHPALVLMGMAGMFVDLLMVACLCMGITEAARGAGKHELARIAESRLNLYVAVLIIAFFLAVFIRPFMPREAAAPVMIPFAVFAFVATCLVMGLMMKASDQLADLGGPPGEMV